MEFKIKEIRNDDLEIKNVKNFLYGQIKKEYGIGPNMKFHYDIESMDQYYINPSCNSFFVVIVRIGLLQLQVSELMIRISNFSEGFILRRILLAFGD